ncbi:hypothetical protein B0H14DRAFT_3476715 [Mycena olivaceomarginata]|nr:hypothetical protein B0H14DRAFT_3476715 [Mycena olivaceomarginata]
MPRALVTAFQRDISLNDIEVQQVYTQQQRFNGYAPAIAHGAARKEVFNKKVLNSNAGEVVFKVRDLVQVLDPKFKKMFLTTKKILPEWLGAFRVKECLLNSYIIETIYGQELDEKYNARRLRPLKAPAGSSLEAYKITRKMEEAERLDGRAADETSGTKGSEPNEDEEDTDEAKEDDNDEDKGWEDEEAEGSTIGAQLSSPHQRTPPYLEGLTPRVRLATQRKIRAYAAHRRGVSTLELTPPLHLDTDTDTPRFYSAPLRRHTPPPSTLASHSPHPRSPQTPQRPKRVPPPPTPSTP